MKARTVSTFDSRAMVARIRQLYGAASDTELARMLGKPRATVAAWSGRNIIPLNVLIDICEEKKASLDWIVYGKEQLTTSLKLPYSRALLSAVVRQSLASKMVRDFVKGGNVEHIATSYEQCAEAVYGQNPTMTEEQLITVLEQSADNLKKLPHNQQD